MSAVRSRPRVRLWMKLAALAALGVVAMHALHLALGNRIASRALAREQVVLGKSIARLVAQQAADPLLVADLVTLHEIVAGTTSRDDHGIVYCFILQAGSAVASSFPELTPADLLTLRAAGDLDPVIVDDRGRRILDLAEPIVGGVGMVRLGLDMEIVSATRRHLAKELGLLAAGIIVLGLLAALFVGRGIARPVGDILAAADHFDPARGSGVPTVRPRGSDEIAELGERFNGMMLRLRTAHAEQERARQRALESERLVALGSLVAGVAHEVNNPLAGLKNCVHRLERSDLPAAKRAEYLSLMGEGLERIEAVMKRLLDFGRPHPNALAISDTAELVREVIRFIDPLLHERRIDCVVLGEEERGRVLVDRRKIGQALVNLVLNAAYVTSDGGAIRVRLVARDGSLGMAVEDDGPGIPREIRDRVLDPFFTTKPEGEGTGLGLPLSRSIVDAHGGELTFDFPQGAGTVATVWLKRAEGVPERERAAS